MGAASTCWLPRVGQLPPVGYIGLVALVTLGGGSVHLLVILGGGSVHLLVILGGGSVRPLVTLGGGSVHVSFALGWGSLDWSAALTEDSEPVWPGGKAVGW